MSHSYTEDQLVEQPAIALFATLGWQTIVAMEEVFGVGGTLGREHKGETVLVSRLRSAIVGLNPAIPSEAIENAVDVLMRDRSAMLPEHANRELYQLLKEGIPVSVPDAVNGGQKIERIRIIDWDHPEKNDFLLVSQMTITGPLYTCRPDLIGFVNGLPLVVIELKKPSVPARAAFDENLTHYKKEIPRIFWYNAVMIASNGEESRIGSITSDWDRFFEWKRIEKEEEPRRVSLEVMLRGTCDKARLLDIIENFTLFSEQKSGLVKIIGQNHQVLGVNRAIENAMRARSEGHGKGGVFWQTQGSGKSFSMVFFSQKILRKQTGNWTFVVITDRVELDAQIAKTFKACGAVSDSEGDACHASSGAHLRTLLTENHRYVFTLIHKFQTTDELCDRRDVIVITDEAHRSQYDTMAMNMRAALPNALFVAFTGTPIIAGGEKTAELFGDYVSIYDFQQSVEDGATVPLYYENRTPELQLVNPDLNDDLYNLIEAAELDPEQESRLEKELNRQYHIITRDDRLESIAKDIVHHYLGRGFLGKAMVVSIDKATALRMHDKVRKHWNAELDRVTAELARFDLSSSEKDALYARKKTLTETDMALIVSPGQNEIEQMKKLGLDIAPHRQRMNESDPPLDERFKDPTDNLSIVFLCAMWLTGFDAPSCSVVYLDKPMRNHTLMQTIARANRVFPEKKVGLIVDYANVFTSLEKALAIYGVGQGGMRPVQEKKKLFASMLDVLKEVERICNANKVKLKAIVEAGEKPFERLTLISNAMNALIAPDERRREFLDAVRLLRSLYKAVQPDTSVIPYASTIGAAMAIADGIDAKIHPTPADISAVMEEIEELLDKSVTGVSDPVSHGKPLDLSKIDFTALKKRFEKSARKNTDLEVLKAAIRAHLDRLIRQNRSRVDFRERFEELIASYNAGSRTIEDLLDELISLSKALNEEEQRHVRENMTEEELVIFDILMRPAPVLSPEERNEVKKVAKELLVTVKTHMVLDWRQKSAARSNVKLAIEDELDKGLPQNFTKELYEHKVAVVFEHVYEWYL